MYSRKFSTLLSVLAFAVLFFLPVVGQNLTTDPAGKLLPDNLGEFRAEGQVGSFPIDSLKKAIENEGITSSAFRSYSSRDGRRVSVVLVTTAHDSGAYAQLTEKRRFESDGIQHINYNAGIGTASFSYLDGKQHHVSFFKGRVSGSFKDDATLEDLQSLESFAKELTEQIDKGEGDIPVLVKHLPNWEEASRNALYFVSVEQLKKEFGSESVFGVVSFESGAEAVFATYGSQQLVIIEYNTPQVATDQNSKIEAKVQELRNQGQPVPTAYRRVGNYSVFVFDAPSELAANQLIDQVKYQQVVQWLGKNPYSYREAVAEFTQTTLGVLVSVVKASGLVLLGSLAIGGFLGALLFTRRRAQQQGNEAYSDAGGMLRLNIDDINPKTDPGRVLGPGN